MCYLDIALNAMRCFIVGCNDLSGDTDMVKENIDLLYILMGLWSIISWYLLMKLYSKYRVLQEKHGDIPEERKQEEHYQGLVKTLLEILNEKFAEIKTQIIINPKNWKE